MELPNVNLLFEYKEATFNDTINGNGLKDGKLHAGKILISAEDTNIADANKRKSSILVLISMRRLYLRLL